MQYYILRCREQACFIIKLIDENLTKKKKKNKESLLPKSLLSLLEHGVRCVRTYVEEEMARQATLRPEMDWSVDAELPQRFKVWKRQVTSELRLQMAADPNKQQLWACTYVIVCAGEQ